MKYIRIIIIYLGITIVANIENKIFYTNIINPIFWGGIIVYLIATKKDDYIRISRNKQYYIYMLIISCLHLFTYFYFGFIFGFVNSPYNHEILALSQNIIINVLPIIGIEVVRFIMVSRNKNDKFLLALITIILILVEIDYSTLINLFSNKEELFKYICSNILPLIASGTLYTYLALKCSCVITIIYRFFKEIIILFLPILPNINWFIEGSMWILSPVIVYVLFKYKWIKDKKGVRKTKENKYAKIDYAITFIILITIVCFMLGIFKYEPIAILSNSMFPAFSRGDVVVFKKLSEEELKDLKKQTTIVYKIGNQNIAHRIVDVIKENDKTFYKTKGDSNNAPDMNLVEVNQIQGIYVFHIKYIGFPSIWLYEYFFNEKNSEVEIQ